MFKDINTYNKNTDYKRNVNVISRDIICGNLSIWHLLEDKHNI